MTPAPDATDDGATGDYHGQPTRRIANEHVWLEVLSAAGPRIIRLGLAGSDDNVLAETPDAGWQTPHGRYELFGGHRLWFAPEDPNLVAVPDSRGLALTSSENGVQLTGQADPATGLVRSIAIELDPTSAAVELRHKLANTGRDSIELAPWSITQLPLGGVATLPQPHVTAEHVVQPNRLLVLWPYASWDDPRLVLADGACSVRGDAGLALKVGTFVPGGRVSYSRNGVTLTKLFEPIPDVRHADLGCNVEVYTDERFLELEVLGPLAQLAPGDEVMLDERWELARSAQT
jgi:hypothetical protein